MHKLIFKIIPPLFLVAYLLLLPKNVNASVDNEKIYYFWGQGCPHCAQVNEFFEEKGFYDKYPIEKKEIYFNRENANLLNEYYDQYDVPLGDRGVPAVFIGEHYLIGGFDIPNKFEALADEFIKDRSSEPAPQNKDGIKPQATGEAKSATTSEATSSTSMKINFLLPAVIAGALADSVNPCEFAVLVLLLTAILSSGSPRRALHAGLLFSLSIFISYLLMGLGLYKALTWGNLPRVFLTFIGVLAVILGLFLVR
ncbi:MAG: hypothetical protein A2172_00670 [Candidatus Woykebacteria bacterium RBG_13_40_15]|uniref:Uncharacterized protein n=1 Tax=Candidatus Woykebacteria bacterium RBG_13_40_15 TaxID=1802593 RepID=A0A1G1W8P7_9BACT|nr:MAG: hypothetical protein A2172_00670 [Candidatus Woykebacteria bacterium RBG_13_40_15]